MSKIELTLNPNMALKSNELRVGNIISAENGKAYKVISADERDGNKVKFEIEETDETPSLFIAFNDKVISYGDICKVVGVKLESKFGKHIEVKRIESAEDCARTIVKCR